MYFCSTCFSRDRRLVSIQILEDVLISLQWMSIDFNMESDQICWECRALLLRIHKFRQQAVSAQAALRQHIEKTEPVKNLNSFSTLTTCKKIFYDAVYCDDVKKELDDYETYDNDETNIIVPEMKIDNTYQFDVEIEKPDFTVTSSKEDVGKSNNDMKYENNNLKLKTETSDAEDDNNLEVEDKSCNVKNENIKVEKLENDLKSTVKDVKTRKNQSKVDKKFVIKKLTMDELLKKRDLDRNVNRFTRAPFKCFQCIIGFVDEQKFNSHISDKHCKADNKYMCSICETWFVSMDLMQSHYEQHFNSYQCKLCPYTHNLLSGIQAHCNSGHDKKKHSCELCGKNFDTRNQHTRHMRIHTDKKVCPHCSKVISPTNFKTHLLIHADGNPSVECDICHKKYRGKNSLKMHLKTHNETKDEAAYCVECDVRYKNMYQYKLHLKTSVKHIKEEDKKFKCPLCVKRFNNSFYLKCHIESHNDTSNYSCDDCKQTFKTRVTLRKHIRRKHGTKPKPRDKVCNICSKAFIDKTVLQQHMNAHMGARPYECDVCGANFSYSGALYTHKKLRHKMQKKKMTQKTTE